MNNGQTFHMIGGRYGPGLFTVILNVIASGACAILTYIVSLSYFTLAIYAIVLAIALTLIFSTYRILPLKRLLERVSDKETVELKYRRVRLGVIPLMTLLFIVALLPIIVVAVFHSIPSFIAVLCVLWGLVNSSVCLGVYIRIWEIRNRGELYTRYILKMDDGKPIVVRKELVFRRY